MSNFLDLKADAALLRRHRLDALADVAEAVGAVKYQDHAHGNLQGWREAWLQLPDCSAEFDLQGSVVRVLSRSASRPIEVNTEALTATLMRFHPWRKGPLSLLDVTIDTEWRSNLKWDRLQSCVDFNNRRVLDVGCGNGYYGWCMLGAGARLVVGCEPFLLSIAQFEVFKKYWMDEPKHCVLPLADVDLPRNLNAFDVTLSMGVLYHRPNPIEHLQILFSSLRRGGQLVLETIVLPDSGYNVLVPEDRYAKMRNVWFIPTVPMLERWLQRTGFQQIRVADVSPTTTNEQRRTTWMTFESLSDFLDRNDQTRTIEGYPAPIRAMLLAQRP